MLDCMRRIAVLIAGAAMALAGQAQQQAASIEVPAGAHVELQAKGEGVQIYGCAASGNGYKWTLQGPDAKLLDAKGRQIGRHFAGPTWQLNDGSTVQGQLVASQPAPDAGSVAWLLLRAKAGSATGKLAGIAFVRRTDTHGGVADSSDCAVAGDEGKTVRVNYTATYTFYAGSETGQ
jgi:hypothetical protein